MENKGKKPGLKESNDPMDLIRMQTEFALLKSMTQSKTLTAVVVIGLSLFAGFCWFLLKQAGA